MPETITEWFWFYVRLTPALADYVLRMPEKQGRNERVALSALLALAED